MTEHATAPLPLIVVEQNNGEMAITLRKQVSSLNENEYIYETYVHNMVWAEGLTEYIEDHFEMLYALFAQNETNARAQQIRQKRDSMLEATDYLMTIDYPISDDMREQLRAYRQALRDITTQDGFPDSVIWPSAPKIQAGNDTILNTLSIIEKALTKLSFGDWWKGEGDNA